MTPRATIISTYDDLLTHLIALVIPADTRIPVGATLAVVADMAAHAGLLDDLDQANAVSITETYDLARRNIPPSIEEDALALFLVQAEQLSEAIESASAG
jgi:hypothetical protein